MSSTGEESPPRSPPQFRRSIDLRKTIPALFEKADAFIEKATKRFSKPKMAEPKVEKDTAQSPTFETEYDRYRGDMCPLLSTESPQEHMFYILFELGLCFFFVLLFVGSLSFTFYKLVRL